MADTGTDRIRVIADNAWLLLFSRLAAGLSVPGILAGFGWVLYANTELAVLNSDIRRHETEITSVERRMTIRETTAYTREDAAAYEARVNRDIDQILIELRAFRQELRESRND